MRLANDKCDESRLRKQSSRSNLFSGGFHVKHSENTRHGGYMALTFWRNSTILFALRNCLLRGAQYCSHVDEPSRNIFCEVRSLVNGTIFDVAPEPTYRRGLSGCMWPPRIPGSQVLWPLPVTVRVRFDLTQKGCSLTAACEPYTG